MVKEFNRGDNTGSAYFHVNQRNGLRWSMADAFLHPVAHRKNLSLRTRCAVQRLTFASDGHGNGSSKNEQAPPRVTGVEWTEGGHLKRAVAAREVILCSGAIASPQLLQVGALSAAALFATVLVSVGSFHVTSRAGQRYRTTARAAGCGCEREVRKRWCGGELAGSSAAAHGVQGPRLQVNQLNSTPNSICPVPCESCLRPNTPIAAQ